jgi:hypothetical protein
MSIETCTDNVSVNITLWILCIIIGFVLINRNRKCIFIRLAQLELKTHKKHPIFLILQHDKHIYKGKDECEVIRHVYSIPYSTQQNAAMYTDSVLYDQHRLLLPVGSLILQTMAAEWTAHTRFGITAGSDK